MARLVLKFKERTLGVYPLLNHRPLTIGRRPDNDVVIDNLSVSGCHARIEDCGDGFVVVDLQSKNGIFLNGEKVSEGPLQQQDVVTIGKHTLVADLTESLDIDQPDGPEPSRPQMPGSFNDNQTMLLDPPETRQMRGEGLPQPPAAETVYPQIDQVTVLAGGDGDRTLSHKPFTIGRNSDADIILTGLWGLLSGNPAATIGKQAGDVFLRFNRGLIKPKCNGASVKGTIRLNHEDIVDVGPVKIRIQLSKRPSQ